MGGNINESRVFWHGLSGCVLVLVRQCRVLLGVWWCRERAGAWFVWVVFGARQRASSGVSFVPASGIAGHCQQPLCGLWCPGVWLMGLLFENYIVDASIWNTHVCVFLQQFLMNEPGP